MKASEVLDQTLGFALIALGLALTAVGLYITAGAVVLYAMVIAGIGLQHCIRSMLAVSRREMAEAVAATRYVGRVAVRMEGRR